ncbi:MAG: ribonuclease HII [Gammaproteobacteria bacterium]|nr:ribonuclease HII [Gammaproteobacteria bacterium]
MRVTVFAGVDEAGRGPLAGPVVAAAVVVRDGQVLPGVTDSKKLTAARRAALFDLICEEAVAWSIASASVAEIDELNILHASMLAMARAIAGLDVQPPALRSIRIDGNRCPELTAPQRAIAQTIVRGDAQCIAIGAASILAKVTRDRMMLDMDARYPGYGFAQHKGYPTKVHVSALRELGVTPEHRMSFRPVREAAAEVHV